VRRRSLANLRLDTITLLQLHVWNDAWADQGDWRGACALSLLELAQPF
jgi:aryl-alcohol dehydrogenase-like predicted oxidoreductase